MATTKKPTKATLEAVLLRTEETAQQVARLSARLLEHSKNIESDEPRQITGKMPAPLSAAPSSGPPPVVDSICDRYQLSCEVRNAIEVLAARILHGEERIGDMSKATQGGAVQTSYGPAKDTLMELGSNLHVIHSEIQRISEYLFG